MKLYIFFKEDSFWCSDNDVVETDKKNKECITKNLSFITHGDVRIPLFRKRSHDVHNVRTSSVLIHMASLAITSPPPAPHKQTGVPNVFIERHTWTKAGTHVYAVPVLSPDTRMCPKPRRFDFQLRTVWEISKGPGADSEAWHNETV